MENADMENAGMENADMANADIEIADVENLALIIIIIIIIELYLPTVLFHYKIKTIYKDESDLPIGRALKYLQVNIIGKLQKI